MHFGGFPAFEAACYFLGISEFKIFWDLAMKAILWSYLPTQDASHHQDDITFFIGNPELNLYMPLLLGERVDPTYPSGPSVLHDPQGT